MATLIRLVSLSMGLYLCCVKFFAMLHVYLSMGLHLCCVKFLALLHSFSLGGVLALINALI
jgi:hypothetical protein